MKRYDCSGDLNTKNHAESIVGWAQKAGKATGFVTTTKVTHATPVNFFSHTTYMT